MKTNRIQLLIAVIGICLIADLQAQPSINQWNFSVHAQNSFMTDSLAILGVRSDATSGFDNIYDIPRPPRAPSGEYLEVYFPHSGGNYPPLLGSKYAVDYQAPADPAWTMSVESSTTGLVLLTWDSVYVQSLDPAIHLLLEDAAAGKLVDMRTAGSYSFTYSVRRDFQIRGSLTVNLTYLMEGFWNGTSQVRDTVKAFLAGASAPYPLLDSSTVYLSSSGNGACLFNSLNTGHYYLVVRHRNHLTVWSTDSLSLTRGTTSAVTYDFSAGGSAYGTDALIPAGSVYVTIGGDVNQDGVIDYLDRNLTWNNRGQNGYLSTDCNGDNLTDAADYAISLGNRYRIVQQPR